MKDKNQNKIFIETDEEIPSIINKINKCASSEVVLVIPAKALVLRSIINLKILKKRAEDVNKNISILKTEDLGVNQNQSIKKDESSVVSSVVKSIDKTLDLNKNINNTVERKDVYQKDNFHTENQDNKVKVFDIVKKVQTPVLDNDVESEHKIFEKEVNHYENEIDERFKKSFNDDKSNGHKRVVKNNKKRKKTIIVSALNSKLLVFFILMIIVTMSIAAFFMYQKADINIVLKKELVSHNFEFTGDESIGKIDINNNKIPLDIIKINSEESASYPTTGKKHIEEEASGKITVFNEYSSTPQRIVANTRFLSKTDNKLFRVRQAVTIPGFSRVEGVDIPGQIVITVYADKAGEEYNINPDAFHLPGLQGSAKYNSIYARSTKAMTGGINQEVAYFSESDYVTAKDKLVKLVKEKNEQDISNKISDEVADFSDLKEVGEIKVDTNIKVGEIAEDFEINVSMQSSIPIILKNDLSELVDRKVDEKLEKNKIVLENSRTFEVGDISTSEDGEVIIPVSTKQYIVAEIDIDKLKEEIANKNEKELTTYFNNINGIKSASISLEPKWINKIPSSYNKINITIDINNSM
ncbi:MAG: hypothetical protein KAI57_04185 [Candidatus Pacebacteria bacterium]|nr:hypothetical protein [Candidatus Paceibacterota bacterium]